MQNLKNYILILLGLGFFLLLFVYLSFYRVDCHTKNIQRFTKDFMTAYQNRNLFQLDSKYSVGEKIKVIIEHSILEEENLEHGSFKSFKNLESWFDEREEDGLPNRNTRTLLDCELGKCEFDFDGGILHNNLYLHKIEYEESEACYNIKTIYFLDGD